MDTSFDVTKWQPTKPPEPGDSVRTEDEVTSLIQKLNWQTIDIQKYPYDPNNWILRAKTLTRLRYPELALGDAHKAGMLCRSHLTFLSENASHGWRMGHRMGFWMTDSEPQDENDHDRLREYLAKLHDRAHRTGVNSMHFHPNFDEGRFRRRMYPWTSRSHRKRSDGLVALLNQEFADNATDVLSQQPYCVVKGYAFGGSADEVDSSDLLGIFAARGIDEEDIILIDKSRTWGCNGPGRYGDHDNLGGGRGCSDLIHPNEEFETIDLDLRWIRDGAGKQASSVLLNVRLLLSCIQDGIEHPLDHPLIARLTPTYAEDKIDVFSLETDIVIPNEALQRFGIDIFANHNFDTWVLFTIQARVLNNSCGDPIAESLNPLFSLFNHSCEPNVDWTTSEDHRTIRVKARRNIKAGEQLLVEYDQFMENQPLIVRRKRMRRWLDCQCQCTKCVREEAEQKQVDLDGRRDSKVEWDTREEVVFPEDLLKN